MVTDCVMIIMCLWCWFSRVSVLRHRTCAALNGKVRHGWTQGRYIKTTLQSCSTATEQVDNMKCHKRGATALNQRSSRRPEGQRGMKLMMDGRTPAIKSDPDTIRGDYIGNRMMTKRQLTVVFGRCCCLLALLLVPATLATPLPNENANDLVLTSPNNGFSAEITTTEFGKLAPIK